MEKYLTTSALALLLLAGSCTKSTETAPTGQPATSAKGATFGDAVSPQKAVAPSALPALLANEDSAKTTVATQVVEVCQKKGCWIKVAVDGQEPMRVTFKDYGFFMPKDIVGKEIVFEGVVVRDTVSVDDQRHYAEDAGKSKEEIAAITSPKPSITFIASGVQIKE
ncbi:DUF4920 domain-containing protein [Rufibacter glacialis]|uniref:DUF4920 domain-containing protein n=1 Tax=Rufibacter glacialis TaxID=1259555 RepID=A0A5M8QH00_9BACT|nr:DUF4920 domain-containing protein [Rufibacter glacialis]KAA6434498.1 DUF4920 domain-containing protein [Rufibacter glacialis]GGK70136.1 hypothetical protein GCM10011405_17750 [Rufibacter glacialis]